MTVKGCRVVGLWVALSAHHRLSLASYDLRRRNPKVILFSYHFNRRYFVAYAYFDYTTSVFAPPNPSVNYRLCRNHAGLSLLAYYFFGKGQPVSAIV